MSLEFDWDQEGDDYIEVPIGGGDPVVAYAQILGEIIDAPVADKAAVRSRDAAIAAVLGEVAKERRREQGLSNPKSHTGETFAEATAGAFAFLDGIHGDDVVSHMTDVTERALHRRANPNDAHVEWSKPRERPEGNAREWLDKRIADDEAAE